MFATNSEPAWLQNDARTRTHTRRNRRTNLRLPKQVQSPFYDPRMDLQGVKLEITENSPLIRTDLSVAASGGLSNE